MAARAGNVERSAYLDLSCFCEDVKVKEETALKVSLFVLSLLIFAAAAGIYSYGSQYLPQFFPTQMSRMIGASVMGMAGLGVDVFLLIYHCCQSEPADPIFEPVVKKRSSRVVYSVDDWEDQTRVCVLTKGESTYDELSQKFQDFYQETLLEKDGDQTAAFKIVVDRLCSMHSKEEAIICLFDPPTRTMRAAAIGGEVRFFRGNLSFEKEARAHHTFPILEKKIPEKQLSLNIHFGEKVIPFL